mmetsp:Transcript_6369/g.7716  ORF Transcript_6369/g.7716 Transcript_6369/m.7716 type:complete len:278 (+) Transcript_6369:854-1687(+)
MKSRHKKTRTKILIRSTSLAYKKLKKAKNSKVNIVNQKQNDTNILKKGIKLKKESKEEASKTETEKKEEITSKKTPSSPVESSAEKAKRNIGQAKISLRRQTYTESPPPPIESIKKPQVDFQPPHSVPKESKTDIPPPPPPARKKDKVFTETLKKVVKESKLEKDTKEYEENDIPPPPPPPPRRHQSQSRNREETETSKRKLDVNKSKGGEKKRKYVVESPGISSENSEDNEGKYGAGHDEDYTEEGNDDDVDKDYLLALKLQRELNARGRRRATRH